MNKLPATKTLLNENNISGHAKMRPRARIISLLGDELISDECVAIVELVKNSYDADAKVVNIKFQGDDPLKPDSLILEDDGIGMNLETVLHGWLEPGTINKKITERSQGGRLMQGAKGIGRFAAARLGKSMFMETIQKNSRYGHTVLFEWGNFTEESYLDEIEIEYETLSKEDFKHGTRLTIYDLASQKIWEEEDYKNLESRLTRLISPFDEISDFKITLEIPQHPEIQKDIEPPPLTKEPEYSLSGRLYIDGKMSASLYKINEEIKKYELYQIGKKDEKVGCGPFDFEIRAWDRDRDGLSPYMLKYDLTISGIRQILNEFCGVSIYRDGFRVHPYGESGDDWLTLDARSRQNPPRNLANNQVIASIKTSRSDNPNLVDRTTREGLVHNLSFSELKKWFIRVISVLEEERYRIRPREVDSKVEYYSSLYEPFDMSTVVIESDRQLGRKHPVTKLVRKKDQEIRDGVIKLQEHYSRVVMAAGLGQMVDLIVHEIGAPLGRTYRTLDKFERYFGKFIKEETKQYFAEIRGYLEQIGSLRAKLDPRTAGRRGRARSFNVMDEIKGNLDLYSNLISQQNISISISASNKPIIVHMSQSVLSQIVINLLDNSIYWLTRHHGDGKGGDIKIKLINLKNGFKIILCDNGPGIEKSDTDLIFDQYFTRKSNGMGLGLYIARQIIQPYGRIFYRDDCELPGACFEVIFEKNTGV